MSAKIAAILPAAGKAAQSRAFKPLLCLGGRTMIERTTDMLRSAGAQKIAVVTGYRGDSLEKHLRADDIEFVRNESYESTSMFDSILLGLNALGDGFDRILITPADVPLIRASTLQKLTQAEFNAAVPVYKGRRGHPVSLGKSVLPLVRAYCGEGGLRGALKSVGAAEIAVDDEGVSIDSDSPEDYYRLLRRFDTTNERGERVPGLWLSMAITCGENVFGDSCALFLELIELTDSMRTACACLNISYTTGWRMINEAEQRLGRRLLLRTAGGASGGGSLLTAEGRELLSSYQRLSAQTREFAQKKFAELFSGFTLPGVP